MSSEKPDLAAVLDFYGVTYNPNRSSQKCLCPVHDDHIKSCSVNLDEQWFACHACGVKGDSWNLIMAKEECDFATAQHHAEGIARTGNSNIRATADAGTVGLFGRTRPGRRDGGKQPFRPRFDRP